MSESKQLLRTERGQRVDQPDFEHGSATGWLDALSQLGEQFLVGRDRDPEDQQRNFILKGFGTTFAASVVTVTKGTAVLSARDAGAIKEGLVSSGGPAMRSINVTTFPAGSYGVWIRFEFRDSDFQNRPFWNATASTPTEFPRNVPTRRAEDWSLAIELTSPGTEWTKIAEVTLPAGTILDRRDFFFEGNDLNSFKVVDAEWGDTDDRFSSRAGFGVFGFYRFVRGVQRQLQDILGPAGSGWWDDPSSGSPGAVAPRSLSILNNKKFETDGSQDIEGTVIPSPTATHDIGSASARWRDIFGRFIELACDATGLGIDLIRNGATRIDMSTGAPAADQSFIVNTPLAGPGANTALLEFQAGGSGQGGILLDALEVDSVGFIEAGTSLTAGTGVTAGTTVTAGTRVAGQDLEVTANAPATMPSQSRVFADTTIRAWGHLRGTGAGTQTFTTNRTIGCTATISVGGNYVIAFDQDFLDADSYAVVCSSDGAAGDIVTAAIRVAGSCEIAVEAPSGTPKSVDTNVTNVSFMIVGEPL